MLDLKAIPKGELELLYQAAEADPDFARKIFGNGLVLSAVSDYSVTGFVISNFPQNVSPGDPIFVDVAGEVGDINAGLFNLWQIAVAAAVVDGNGRPTNVKAFKTFGSTFPYIGSIIITDPQNILSPHTHLELGTMPDHSIKVKVQLFANHSNSPAWNWDYWQYQNGPLPGGGWDMIGERTTDTSITPPKEPINWLLWGAIAGGAALVVTGVILFKK